MVKDPICGMEVNPKRTKFIHTSLLRVGGVSNVKTNVAVKEVEIRFNSSKTNESSLMAAVKNAGYENHVTKESSHEEDELKEIKNLKRRFIISLIFSLPLLYFMFSDLFVWPSLNVSEFKLYFLQV